MNKFIGTKNVFNKELLTSDLTLKPYLFINNRQDQNETIFGFGVQVLNDQKQVQGEIEYTITRPFMSSISRGYAKELVDMMVPQCNGTLSENYKGEYQIMPYNQPEFDVLLNSSGITL